LTNPQVAQVFSRALGKPVFKKLPMPLVRLFLGREFYQMFRWFNEAGFAADGRFLPGTYSFFAPDAYPANPIAASQGKVKCCFRNTKLWHARFVSSLPTPFL
jgi:hypothetical protein